MPTDTLYGIVGRAEDPRVVERIYKIRRRTLDKPCIILIRDVSELDKFHIDLSDKQKSTLKKYWSSSGGGSDTVSLILDCPEDKFSYLHRGTQTLAFRLPEKKELRDLLLKVGPLIAPSANIEGFSPAKSTEEAKKYFGESVDLYVDVGIIESKASKIRYLGLGIFLK